jgi:cyclophilin family peptidyl-prolyl cis-trans isomerase
MKKVSIVFLLLFAPFLFSFSKSAKKKETKVQITTNFGVITVKLFNDTPIHRDNFIKLVKSGQYDSLLFHRVIEQFMVQGGDPESKNASDSKKLGDGDVGYTLKAEFVSNRYHKRGALAAARKGDRENPEMESSGIQFYIVQGRVFTPEDFERFESMRYQEFWNKAAQTQLNKPESKDLRDKLSEIKKSKEGSALDSLMTALKPIIDPQVEKYKYTEEQRLTYMTDGGAPHLDQLYTVFGEVIEGMDVVDKIAAIKTDKNDRPLENVRFSMKIVK